MPNTVIKSRLPRLAVLVSASLLILLFGWGWFVWQAVLHDHRNSGINSILTGIVQYEQTYKTYPPKLSALGGRSGNLCQGGDCHQCLLHRRYFGFRAEVWIHLSLQSQCSHGGRTTWCIYAHSRPSQ